MLDIFLNKAFTWLRAKAQSRHSQYSRYMFCGIASDKSEIPLRILGSAREGVDFRLIDPPKITIYPFTEKGSILLDVIQEDVSLYATRTLIVEIEEDQLKNVQAGSLRTQVNTIIGALEMKDCSGIKSFLKENRKIFSSFELNASKSRCILSLPSDFLFESGSADLKHKHLENLGRFLQEFRTRYKLEGDVIRVEGHTDDVPMGKKIKYSNYWYWCRWVPIRIMKFVVHYLIVHFHKSLRSNFLEN